MEHPILPPAASQDAEHRLERRQLLLPAAELTFEVARPALDAEVLSTDKWVAQTA